MANKNVDELIGIPVVLPNITAPVAYSPQFTITGGAMTGHAHQSMWSQDVYFMDLDISFTGGTTTGTITNFSIQLPLNPATGLPFTIGGPVGSRFMGGGVDGFGLITNRFDGTIQGVQGDTNVTINLDAGNSFATAGSGRSLRATIRLPIAEFLLTGYLAYGAGQALASRLGLIMGGTVPGKIPSSATDGVAAGYIGEYIEALSTGFLSVASDTWSTGNNPGIPLQPGIWDLQSTCQFNPNNTTTVSRLTLGISTSSIQGAATPAGVDARRNLFSLLWNNVAIDPNDLDLNFVSPLFRVNISVPTTYYPVSVTKFAASTMQTLNQLFARRVG